MTNARKPSTPRGLSLPVEDRSSTGPTRQSRKATRLALHLGPLAVAGVFVLAGCPSESVNTLPGATPTTTNTGGNNSGATTSPAPTRDGQDIGATTNGTLAGAQLRVVAKDPAGAALVGAQVGVFGPGLAFGTTSATGDIVLGPLPLGTYELRVSAPGKLPLVKQVSLSVVRSRSTEEVSLGAATRTLSGKVRGPQGQVLAGARVALGTSLTMTDKDGAYSLAAPADGTAEVRKTGYEPGQTSGGDVTLNPTTCRVSFENAPFGLSAATAFATLRSALSGAGWAVSDGDGAAHVRVWAAPSTVSDSQAHDAANFVAAGGKLVVLGDWAGASQYSPDATNKLLMPLGAIIDANLVRVPGSTLGRPEWFTPVLSADTPAGLGTLQLLGAATVAAAPPAVRILSVPQDGYQVQATGDPGGVAAARQIGSGLLIVLGDASAWLDPEIARSDNLSFIRNVLLW